jgi:hypothetical protein
MLGRVVKRPTKEGAKMVGDLQDLKRRIASHFADDDLTPDVVRELATVLHAVLLEVLREKCPKAANN